MAASKVRRCSSITFHITFSMLDTFLLCQAPNVSNYQSYLSLPSSEVIVDIGHLSQSILLVIKFILYYFFKYYGRGLSCVVPLNIQLAVDLLSELASDTHLIIYFNTCCYCHGIGLFFQRYKEYFENCMVYKRQVIFSTTRLKWLGLAYEIPTDYLPMVCREARPRCRMYRDHGEVALHKHYPLCAPSPQVHMEFSPHQRPFSDY